MNIREVWSAWKLGVAFVAFLCAVSTCSWADSARILRSGFEAGEVVYDYRWKTDQHVIAMPGRSYEFEVEIFNGTNLVEDGTVEWSLENPGAANASLQVINARRVRVTLGSEPVVGTVRVNARFASNASSVSARIHGATLHPNARFVSSDAIELVDENQIRFLNHPDTQMVEVGRIILTGDKFSQLVRVVSVNVVNGSLVATVEAAYFTSAFIAFTGDLSSDAANFSIRFAEGRMTVTDEYGRVIEQGPLSRGSLSCRADNGATVDVTLAAITGTISVQDLHFLDPIERDEAGGFRSFRLAAEYDAIGELQLDGPRISSSAEGGYECTIPVATFGLVGVRVWGVVFAAVASVGAEIGVRGHVGPSLRVQGPQVSWRGPIHAAAGLGYNLNEGWLNLSDTPSWSPGPSVPNWGEVNWAIEGSIATFARISLKMDAYAGVVIHLGEFRLVNLESGYRIDVELESPISPGNPQYRGPRLSENFYFSGYFSGDDMAGAVALIRMFDEDIPQLPPGWQLTLFDIAFGNSVLPQIQMDPSDLLISDGVIEGVVRGLGSGHSGTYTLAAYRAGDTTFFWQSEPRQHQGGNIVFTLPAADILDAGSPVSGTILLQVRVQLDGFSGVITRVLPLASPTGVEIAMGAPIGVGIRFISTSGGGPEGYNQISLINFHTSGSSVLTNFVFDGGGWIGSLAVDPWTQRAYAASGVGTIYAFDLSTGAYFTRPLGFVAENLDSLSETELVVVRRIPNTASKEVRRVTIATGGSTPVASFEDEAQRYTFTVDPVSRLAYEVIGGGLVQINVDTGAVVAFATPREFNRGLGILSPTELAGAYGTFDSKTGTYYTEFWVVNVETGSSIMVLSGNYGISDFAVDRFSRKLFVPFYSDGFLMLELNLVNGSVSVFPFQSGWQDVEFLR